MNETKHKFDWILHDDLQTSAREGYGEPDFPGRLFSDALFMPFPFGKMRIEPKTINNRSE